MSEELKEKYCSKCANSDEKLNCISKQEAPFDSFICDNGEMFEELPFEEERLQEEQERDLLYEELMKQNYDFEYGDVKY